MGKLEKLSNGRHVFHGFSTKNPDDIKQLTTLVKKNFLLTTDEIPNKNWKKTDIKNWLINKKYTFAKEVTKKELLKLVEKYK